MTPEEVEKQTESELSTVFCLHCRHEVFSGLWEEHVKTTVHSDMAKTRWVPKKGVMAVEEVFLDPVPTMIDDYQCQCRKCSSVEKMSGLTWQVCSCLFHKLERKQYGLADEKECWKYKMKSVLETYNAVFDFYDRPWHLQRFVEELRLERKLLLEAAGKMDYLESQAWKRKIAFPVNMCAANSLLNHPLFAYEDED